SWRGDRIQQSAMTGRSNAWLLTCCLVGLAASTAAAYIHYRILFDPHYVSFCDVNATFNCSQVYVSRFGTAFGLPVAVFGAIGFALALIVAVAGLVGPPDVRESAPGYLFAFSTLALAVVLYLGYASVAILKTYCLLCLVTYAAVIGLFLISGAATSFPMTMLPRRAARDLRLLAASPLAIAVAVLFIGGPARVLSTRGAGGRDAGDFAGSALRDRALHGDGVPRPAHHSERRRESAHRQVQRLPVPGVRPVVPAVQAGAGQVRVAIPGRR